MLPAFEIFVVAYLMILLVLLVIAYASLKSAYTLNAGLNEVIKGLAAVEARLTRIEEKQE